ncbi:MAG: GTPase domain-containing protein [Anaerolineales bacterium]|nr:GTPase domain-containing protein [Anaerolineales bacterium]MCB8991429.1 GTPase domain-containing protein [Ardenticatenaceae bacterium]MCB9003951.1 GTPase domain-containing protein [Ardenticatenaceae bacterium]
MHINWQLRRLNLKIVYYGPALSGKTTNIEKIHQSVDPRRRSDLVSLKTAEDRTLYFDFLQLELGKISGLTPNIQLYTVPGQAYYEASRRLVLRGADGVVFVADSAMNRLRANVQSWRDMHSHLSYFGVDWDYFPVVVQFNKRDASTAVPVAALQKVLRVNGYPCFEAVALHGQGVLPTLKAITKQVIAQVQREQMR